MFLFKWSNVTASLKTCQRLPHLNAGDENKDGFPSQGKYPQYQCAFTEIEEMHF